MASYYPLQSAWHLNQNAWLSRATATEAEPWLSEPIAAVASQRIARATLSDWLDGQPVFVREVPFRLVEAKKHLRTDPPHTDMPPPWRARDVVVTDPDILKRGSEFSAIVANYPYSTGWLERAPFKREYSKGYTKQQIARLLGEAIARHRKIPGSHREYLRDDVAPNVDETRKRHLTATLALPIKAPAQLISGQRGRIEESEIFGVCARPEECVKAVMSGAVAKELLARTLDGTILEIEFSGDFKRRKQIELAAEHRTCGEPLLAWCAWVALAGPHQDIDSWIEQRKPVAALAKEIYLDLIYCLQRRSTLKDAGGLLEEPGAIDFCTMVQRFEHVFSETDVPTEAWLTVLEKVAENLGSGEPSERIEGCAIVAALRRVLDPEDLPTRELAKLTKDPDASIQKAAARAIVLIREIGQIQP